MYGDEMECITEASLNNATDEYTEYGCGCAHLTKLLHLKSPTTGAYFVPRGRRPPHLKNECPTCYCRKRQKEIRELASDSLTECLKSVGFVNGPKWEDAEETHISDTKAIIRQKLDALTPGAYRVMEADPDWKELLNSVVKVLCLERPRLGGEEQERFHRTMRHAVLTAEHEELLAADHCIGAPPEDFFGLLKLCEGLNGGTNYISCHEHDKKKVPDKLVMELAKGYTAMNSDTKYSKRPGFLAVPPPNMNFDSAALTASTKGHNRIFVPSGDSNMRLLHRNESKQTNCCYASVAGEFRGYAFKDSAHRTQLLRETSFASALRTMAIIDAETTIKSLVVAEKFGLADNDSLWKELGMAIFRSQEQSVARKWSKLCKYSKQQMACLEFMGTYNATINYGSHEVHPDGGKTKQENLSIQAFAMDNWGAGDTHLLTGGETIFPLHGLRFRFNPTTTIAFLQLNNTMHVGDRTRGVLNASTALDQRDRNR